MAVNTNIKRARFGVWGGWRGSGFHSGIFNINLWRGEEGRAGGPHSKPISANFRSKPTRPLPLHQWRTRHVARVVWCYGCTHPPGTAHTPAGEHSLLGSEVRAHSSLTLSPRLPKEETPKDGSKDFPLHACGVCFKKGTEEMRDHPRVPQKTVR